MWVWGAFFVLYLKKWAPRTGSSANTGASTSRTFEERQEPHAILALMSAVSELQMIVSALKESGLKVELPSEALNAVVVEHEGTVVGLLFEGDAEGGYQVQLNLSLDMYVHTNALADVLLGINFLNQELRYGLLILELLDLDTLSEEEWIELQERFEDEGDGDIDPSTMFSVVGQAVLWLPHLGPAELDRLVEHLSRFEQEMVASIERHMSSEVKGLSA